MGHGLYVPEPAVPVVPPVVFCAPPVLFEPPVAGAPPVLGIPPVAFDPPVLSAPPVAKLPPVGSPPVAAPPVEVLPPVRFPPAPGAPPVEIPPPVAFAPPVAGALPPVAKRPPVLIAPPEAAMSELPPAPSADVSPTETAPACVPLEVTPPAFVAPPEPRLAPLVVSFAVPALEPLQPAKAHEQTIREIQMLLDRIRHRANSGGRSTFPSPIPQVQRQNRRAWVSHGVAAFGGRSLALRCPHRRSRGFAARSELLEEGSNRRSGLIPYCVTLTPAIKHHVTG